MVTCELVEQRMNQTAYMPTTLARKYFTPRYPCIDTEQTGDRDTGELILPIRGITRWIPTETVISYINALNGNTTDAQQLRMSLIFKLNHNTPSDKPTIAHERPVSAYFFCDEQTGKVIVEWGRINPQNDEAKLHKMLNRTARVKQLIAQGMKLSSGHIAKICSGREHLANFDSIGPDTPVTQSNPMGKTINTLYNHGFIILTAEGRVQLPAF